MNDVRDVANEQLVQGSVADTREVLRRLVVRLRHLRRLQALVEGAIEEALRWIPVSLRTRPWNARLQEDRIWQEILRAEGRQLGASFAVATEDHAHVLLQPNLPIRNRCRK